MTDQELANHVEAAKRGETEAYRFLFAVLEPKIFAFVRYRVPTLEVAEDVVQDSLVAIFRSLDTFVVLTPGQFYRYVYTIIRRQLAHYYENKHVQASSSQVITEESSWIAPLEDSTLTGDVARALATLDPITREIVVLHHWSLYTFGEIAAMLELEEGTVRTRHHRAKATLASLLV